MTNSDFLSTIRCSFEEFLVSGTSRSTKKLKPLHGAIAKDIAGRLGDGYTVVSQGWGDDREEEMQGRYINKKVDITVMKGNEAVAGIGVKFVMQNYSQNSNNYFENMLGETANIRANNHPYFQVFIIFDKLPHYDRGKNINAWETITAHNIEKYRTLSRDNIETFFHAPNKTLMYVVHIPDNEKLRTLKEYLDYYRNERFEMTLSDRVAADFGSGVILNDYERFASKVYHSIMAV